MADCGRDIAYEAYRQGAMDADPLLTEADVQEYFEKWWARRVERRQLETWDRYWDVR